MTSLNKYWIAAISGGPDSMAMLDKYKQKIIGVCHVNYHKRIDSNTDQKIVTNFCQKYEIPIFILNVDKKIYAKPKQNNFQALARTIRYDFFVKCAKKIKCNNLLVAHNLNDFLETAKMQEKRKSCNFFYGIKQKSSYKNLIISRPLINYFKEDLILYCKKHNINFAIDSTNKMDLYERNRIRKQLNKLSRYQLKKLKKFYDDKNRKNLKVYNEIKKELNKWEKTNFSIKYFKNLKLNQQKIESLIYMFLKKNDISNVNHNKIKLVDSFIFSNKNNKILRIENNVRLIKNYSNIKFLKIKR